MSDIVLNASAVADIVTYVAPGYLAYTGYRLHYPAPERSSGHVLILAVVFSLPLVAAAHLLPGGHKPTELGYVLALLVGSGIVGYITARLRGTKRAQRLLSRLGYKMMPDGSIYAGTIAQMSDNAMVQVELKDGRRILGYPRIGPQHKEDGINELYLLEPEASDGETEMVRLEGTAGVIVPLSEISNIALSEDPTHGIKKDTKNALSTRTT